MTKRVTDVTGRDAVVSRTDELINGREWRDRELLKREGAAPPSARDH